MFSIFILILKQFIFITEFNSFILYTLASFSLLLKKHLIFIIYLTVLLLDLFEQKRYQLYTEQKKKLYSF